jgi:hypothetical protein
MTTAATAQRRELAHRSTNGIEVTLLWTKTTNEVTVAVINRVSDEALEFDVAGTMALDAFNHPYAYAVTRQVRDLRATRLATSW